MVEKSSLRSMSCSGARLRVSSKMSARSAPSPSSPVGDWLGAWYALTARRTIRSFLTGRPIAVANSCKVGWRPRLSSSFRLVCFQRAINSTI